MHIDTLGDRVKKARKYAGLTQTQLAKKVETSQGAISDLENDRNKDSSSLYDIAKVTGVSTDWLIKSQGEMLDEPKKPSVEELKAQIREMQGQGDDNLFDSTVPQDTKKVSAGHGMDGMIPVISWVAAGSFSDVLPVTIDDVIEWIPKPAHLSARAFGLVIQGRSMWPEFKPAEIIYVEPEINPWDLIDGDLIVIHCNDDKQATFKQLVLGDSLEDMYLKPLNEDWPDQKIIPMGECQLVGIVDSKYVRYRQPKMR